MAGRRFSVRRPTRHMAKGLSKNNMTGLQLISSCYALTFSRTVGDSSGCILFP